jgi:DNA-binding transcriptional regulator YiaG
MDDTAQEFIKKLRAWRERNHYSQRAAAEFLKISKRTYQNWEQGHAMPQGLAMRYVETVIATVITNM